MKTRRYVAEVVLGLLLAILLFIVAAASVSQVPFIYQGF